MSALLRQFDGFGYAGLRLTADEFLSLGETSDRYELVDGVVVMSPGASYPHQKIMALLFRQLDRYAESMGGDLVTDADVRLADNLVYRPDLVYLAPGRVVGLPQTLVMPPDLVIEILSPTSKPRDLITKRADYERFGVAEYWVVDPDTGNVRAFQRIRPGAAFAETVAAGDTLSSTALPGFVLGLAPIREVCTRR
jgi:Uma2 family endonuclease